MDERTTIQVSNEIRKELKVLASKRDCSYEDLLEEMISVFKELDNTKTTVTIPSALAEKIRERCKGTGFSSISDYITYALRQLIANVEQKEKKKPHKEEVLSKKDEQVVKERLRKLGYLD